MEYGDLVDIIKMPEKYPQMDILQDLTAELCKSNRFDHVTN